MELDSQILREVLEMKKDLKDMAGYLRRLVQPLDELIRDQLGAPVEDDGWVEERHGVVAETKGETKNPVGTALPSPPSKGPRHG